VTVGLVGLLLAGCGGDDEEQVCAPEQQTVLFEGPLARNEPSTAFTVDRYGTVFVALTADPDYNSAEVFSVHASLTVFAVGSDPEAPAAVDRIFDRVGQYRPMRLAAGDYQVVSTKRPEVKVVKCPDN
jgi:hypothetical protein